MENSDMYKGDILVVDDRLENVNLLFDILSECGYEVRQVLTGKQALNAVNYDPPDLILLDIMMPEMDGYEVCKQLKSSETTKDIPVIFLSALKEVTDQVKAFEVGGADYIAKPFEVEEVLIRVKNQLTIIYQKKQLELKNEQLQKAQKELQLLNEEILRSNRELEEFTSIVSHDLRQPLTTIKSFAELLLLKYPNLFEDKPKQFLQYIIDGSLRMDQLINDLLTYARIGGINEIELQEINLNDLIHQLLINLNQDIENNQATINITNLPNIVGDRSKLIELWQNLIANAIKYRKKETPIINISATEDEEYWNFQIEDNGIGIESQYYQKIFQIFQRLHSKEEYPGTGVGLAICKKIVDFHGGNIWVESEYGQSSTFHFTISKTKV
jgi:two-component system, sensor histidine kinase and response regulator